VWMDASTRATLTRRFGYCFHAEKGYPAILDDAGDLHDARDVVIDGPGGAVAFTPLAQDHGLGTPSLGFRFGPAAYSNDLVAMPEQTLARLGGLDLWIVDALRYTPHPTHAHLAQALAWAEAIKPRQTMLTNMHIDLDYRTLLNELPPNVAPAYDGWSMELTL
ncbi:MAG: MBL fold metallo-hydrolase, partial [Hyphomonadaceae bacterium]